MFIHYRTEGFFLKKMARGESDQLFTIYTKDFGKLEILAKAVRKIKSKLRSGADLFYFSELEFIQGKRYKTLTDAVSMERFRQQRKDLRKTAIAHKVSELCCKLVKDGEQDNGLWQLLKKTFERLNNVLKDKSTYLLIYYYFLWNLVSLLGYKPELRHCFFCHKKITIGKFYFSASNGGIMCQNCFEENAPKAISIKKDCRIVEANVIKILRLILQREWNTLAKVKIGALHQKQLQDISEYFVGSLPSYSK
ncbi:MAG: DNA repair protein RecO [Candidatus Wildermuthbacteria bacterium RIFCSPLOWO2_12_FULL_40_9]|uniref:DNA repair protein RecO n=2 Tax=Candidatus Wildermuthiibacteriota TaxID=1817923 RepID=A0A1G2RE51_9BACT|nr:MAG: DNA repair protein RecO [Candidatus Wildermuthbacteria bacterium RIFCSPHIGHO2_12_FULL_40_12]OHA76926.1 MAG: DNA repair protein RecO [Candidatus Wildermuthbacteria bacterium RIFCSPLOWO2_12_FULL_40_9]